MPLPVNGWEASASHPALHVHAKEISQRLTSLDAIRGVAALAVVMSHAIEESLRLMPPDIMVTQLLRAFAIDYSNLGRIGVVAFFCVSGYVIPFSFGHNRPVPSFLVARFFRLYPAYWVSICGVLLLAPLLNNPFPSGAQILANITMVQAVLGQPDLIGVYWTLFYELIFYGLCLIAFITNRMQSPSHLVTVVVCFSGIGLVAAGLRHSGIGPSVPIGIFVFLAIMHLGTLTRVLDRDATPQARRCFAVGLATVLITAGPIVSIGFIQHASNQRLIADVTSIYIGLALFFAMRRRERLATAPLLFLGKISYSLYLMHPLCLVALIAMVGDGRVPFAPILILFGVPACAIAIAALAEHLVERPSNALGRKVRRRLLGV